MAHSTEQAVVAALEVALRDHGWIAASDPARLRATLSDLLGAHADEHRGALDAIVVSAEEGVPADLRSAGRSGAALLRADLVARLLDWGMATDRAVWVVDAWQSLVPESTLEVPLTPPPEPEAQPEPEPETRTEPGTEPETRTETGPAVPPPATPDATALPPANGSLGSTELPPASRAPTRGEDPAPLVATELPRVPATSLPSPVLATSLPPASGPARADHPPREHPPREHPVGDGQPAAAGPVVRGRLPWIAAAVALVVLAGAGVAVALNGGDDASPSSKPDPTDTSTPTGTSEPTVTTLPTGRLVAAPGVRVPPASGRVAMGGRTGGVRVTAYGEVDQLGSGDDAQVAESGAHLVGFTLAKGPCQDGPCRGWKGLGLRVIVDGRARALPSGGPTFVVAAAEDAEVELGYDVAGFDQRVSLLTGDATGQNIAVLARAVRKTRVVGGPKLMDVTVSNATGPVNEADRLVKVGGAELYFFGQDGEAHPQRPNRAFLTVDLSFTRPAFPDQCVGGCAFHEEVVDFVADGIVYDARAVITSRNTTRLVCLVPADVQVGTLVIGGADASTAGSYTYVANLERTTFRVDFRR